MRKRRYDVEMPKRFQAKLQMLQRRAPPDGALLDLGSADGMFARIARECGFKVTTGDFVPESVETPLGLVVAIDLDTPGGVPFPDSSFDIVTLFSCIEHVRRPASALGEIHRLLRPGGFLGLDTPAVGDWCERNYRGRSHWICPPEHLHLFSKEGLSSLLATCGFRVVYHAQSFERTRLRYLARKGRNYAVAASGWALRKINRRKWESLLQTADCSAGDIQFVIAVRPTQA
jgi:SAM-dependent methyltransferase